MRRTVKILTLVSNGLGVGPGHSAIQINDTVYSFEDTSGWFASKSGWLSFPSDRYMEKNAFRPVFLQRLNSKVLSGACLDYIASSMVGDCDYLTSGVCSSQVANAVAAGYRGGFNPRGIDTPRSVFWLANTKGIVEDTELVWSGYDSIPLLERTLLERRLLAEYSRTPEEAR